MQRQFQELEKYIQSVCSHTDKVTVDMLVEKVEKLNGLDFVKVTGIGEANTVLLGFDFTDDDNRPDIIKMLEKVLAAHGGNNHQPRLYLGGRLGGGNKPSINVYREWHKTYALVLFKLRIRELIRCLGEHIKFTFRIETIFQFVLTHCKHYGKKELSKQFRDAVKETDDVPLPCCIKKGVTPPSILGIGEIAASFPHCEPSRIYHGSSVMTPKGIDPCGPWSPLPSTMWSWCENWFKKWLNGYYGDYVAITRETWVKGQRRYRTKVQTVSVYEFVLDSYGGRYMKRK